MRLFFLLALFTGLSYSQVVQTDPPYAGADDTFKVIFDASQGDAGLKGYNGDDVYAHTGVTIEGEGTWQYVIADWNVNLSKAKLSKIGTDLWELNIGNPYAYYGVPQSKKITQLSFVFRNSDGSKTGRDNGGADIFLDMAEGNISVRFIAPRADNTFGDPRRSPAFTEGGTPYTVQSTAFTKADGLARQVLYLNDQAVDSTSRDTLSYTFTPTEGMAVFTVIATDSGGAKDTARTALMVNAPVENSARPQGTIDGINYKDATTAVLSLLAPGKKHVYLLGDFNDWMVDEAYALKKDSVDALHVHWWLEVANLSPGTEYAFQYLVDGEIRIADPYTDKILDPWNDSYIPESVYPNLKPYPAGKTEQAVAVLQTAQTAYIWNDAGYQPPPKEELVVYELLVRDFVADHRFKTVIDSLDYLQNMGINAIHVMPFSEFEGNESWGYNPSFYFAVDKYYGTKNDFKAFVDSCHARGIAVIQDIVLNHSFGQSPMVRLYADGTYGPPSEDNPWFNVTARHPFNVGYDFNHESILTQELVDRVLDYWMSEYHVDGFRFDLSKGFTQKYTGDDVAAWSAFDGSRIALLRRMANKMWEKHPDAYVILEHFADNNEETILAGDGMLLWGNLNHDYNEATMGYSSDLSWGYYKERGWSKAGLMTYMESHDEERLMYKNLQYGNSYNGYDITELATALDRVKLAAAFFLTLPGPKMIWQFGELGYDYSIDYNGRTGNKPVRWDYLYQPERQKLYKTFAALLKLRNSHHAFRSPGANVEYALAGTRKRITIKNWDLNASIIGNFGVRDGSIDPKFKNSGIWYDYFTGDSIQVADPNAPISLKPGEFHIYTDKKLETPEAGLTPTKLERLSGLRPERFELEQNYPNPFNPATTIRYRLPLAGQVTITLYDQTGRLVKTLVDHFQQSGVYALKVDMSGLSSGVYYYRIKSGQQIATRKMVLLR